MATWEEYYTGTLALPVINGPNEGLLIMYSIYFGTAIVGPAIWTQPNIIFPQLNNNHVFVLVTIISGLGQCFFSGTCLIFLYVWHDVFEKSNLFVVFYCLAQRWSRSDLWKARRRMAQRLCLASLLSLRSSSCLRFGFFGRRRMCLRTTHVSLSGLWGSYSRRYGILCGVVSL